MKNKWIFLVCVIVLLFVFFPMPMLGILAAIVILLALAGVGFLVRRWLGIENEC